MRSLRLTALLLVLPAAALAQRSLRIERFDAEAVVLPSGKTIITERITANFTGQWNGIYRSIPVNYDSPQNLNYQLILKVESVADDAGNALRYEVENERGQRKIKMWVPGANNATRTVVLRYRVDNMLRFFDEHDELYWNVTGFDWDVPLENVTARVVLPAAATGIRSTSYTGGYGSSTTAAADTIIGNSVEFSGVQLGFRENLTAVVGWAPGAVERPTSVEKAGATLRANLILMLPLLVLFVMWQLWQKHGRDPRRLPIAPAYEPPTDMTPAEAGTLIDGTPDLHDITATLVDLAVRGYLTIEEKKQEQLFGLISSTRYHFRRTRDPAEWDALQTHERRFLAGLFGGREAVWDDELKNEFYKELPPIKEALVERLIERGYYKRRPDSVRATWIVVAAAAAVGTGFLGGALNASAGVDAPTHVIAAILTGLIIAVFGMVMPARTVYGARVQEKVLGFEEFLTRVESDRFDRVIKTPELFEKYLPYAMAFKVDSNWCRAFEGICTEPPRWYTGSNMSHFSTLHLNSSLGRMAATTTAAMTAAPRSSSGSSGFGGGGFSGGGFGGGGGGGF